MRKIELLAPAKDLEAAIAAVDHGADAVYMGGARFGARRAAANSAEDVARAAEYAHRYGARLYAALNTVIFEDELAAAESAARELIAADVDALIVQDMALLEMSLPPIPLHASTQMDNRTPEKARFLQELGFSQVVLARELSLEEIRAVHEACDVSLEVFVHGALCVSYSGQCYVSQHCFGRSANRGECAQFCRLKFDMTDRDGRVIERGKHLLSLKDMNRSGDLERLLDAGVSSLKIEGRLKDAAYVKNVTAWYRNRLDDIFKRRPEYRRASSGHVALKFTPQLDKSFNRGFTRYFLDGRTPDIFSFHTPKAVGEEVGTVKAVQGNHIVVAGVKPFANGDGLCFLDAWGNLQGFRVNRVEDNKIYPAEMPRIRPHVRLYRNFDKAFSDVLARPSAVRKIGVDWHLEENGFGFSLTLSDEDGNRVTKAFPYAKEPARSPQVENLRVQLAKLGNTPYEATAPATIDLTADWFLPASVVTEWRRLLVECLTWLRRINYRQELSVWRSTRHPYPDSSLTYLGNVMNDEACNFYIDHGVRDIAPAYEKQAVPGAVLMFCRHCLRYSMGWCPVRQKSHSPYPEPY